MSKPTDDFFVGWAELPSRDRRFFLKSGIAMTSLAAVGAAGVALVQRPPSPGGWDLSQEREFVGLVSAAPYPVLWTSDIDGQLRPALLACEGKCGVQARIDSVASGPVVVRGTLIQRGAHAMIAVSNDADWIDVAPPSGKAVFALPQRVDVTSVALEGEILDTKCWFGAMNPAENKPHKACASLCIRGGIPPAFYVEDVRQQRALMILTQRGQRFGPDLLPLVGEPVRISGQVTRAADLLFLDTSISRIHRLS